MKIPDYPEFAPITLDMRDEMYPVLNMQADGISEFTFSALYLFRACNGYRISRVPNTTLVVSGEKDGKTFFYTPCRVPDGKVLGELHERFGTHMNISESQALERRIELENLGYTVAEDRDNFDYLYCRKDLAELAGKEYHKKRNLVNAFINSYSYEQHCITPKNVDDAIGVARAWREAKGIEGDTESAVEGLERIETLGMRGCVYYVDGKAVGFALGEPLAKGRMFAVHFEKALEGYKGIYQFVNQAFAQGLPSHIKMINREQDLGDEGLRQAKMTYRPVGFVKKYKATRKQS